MKNSLILIFITLILLGCFHFTKNETYSKENTISLIDKNINLFKPYKTQTDSPDLEATIVSSVLLNQDKKIILYEKNLNEKTAIASLTKLMTAVVTIDNYPLDSKIIVDETMLTAWGTARKLKIGEHITVRDLLHIMLIESSNDASECLASKVDRDNFMILMNEKAKKLKMKSSYFLNPSGLDEEDDSCNISSAKDLTILVAEIIDKYPIITEILSKKEYYMASGHKMVNTNTLLKEIPYETWGKTGYTQKANECLILMTKTPFDDTIINIIINSNDRFSEMKNLINWTEKSFSF